ncbi:MAG: hypothetical protein V4550_20505 [Gemmatimonadota bacterium]
MAISTSLEQLAVGGAQGCGLDSAGAVYCWGNNQNAGSTPTLFATGGTFDSIYVALNHTCGFRAGAALVTEPR